MADKPKDSKPENDVKIFSSDDEKLKPLGKTLNSDYSRNIRKLLRSNEMTANEIAKETGMSLPLVIHHLNIMLKSGTVFISSTRFNSKNQPMKCYRANTGILILPEKAAQKAKESRSLANALRRVMKFAGICIAGVVSWMAIRVYQMSPESTEDIDLSIIITGEAPPGQDIPVIEPVEFLAISIVIPIAIVASGIFLERILSRRFGKKRKKRTS